MDKYKLWLIGAVVVMAGLVGLGWLLGVGPQLSAADAANSENEQVELQNRQLEATAAALRADNENREQYEEDAAQLAVSVPQTLDYDSFLEGLRAAATKLNVTISSITASTATLYAEPKAAGPDTQTDPLITDNNFVMVPIEISMTAPNNAAILSFVDAIQNGKRLFLVNIVSLADDTATPSAAAADPDKDEVPSVATATVSGYIYVLSSEPITVPQGPQPAEDTDTAGAAGGDGSESPAPGN